MAGLIATPHVAASEAGAQAFAGGGTAVDAALAAASVLTVVYPHNCALGGDLFALLRQPSGVVHAINASGTAPALVDLDALRSRGDSLPIIGVDSITTPGLIAGWGRLHELGGRRRWGENLEVATHLAREGAEVVSGLAAAIQELENLASNVPMARLFAPGGRRLRTGERLVQRQLATSLERLTDDGPAAFYQGEIGEQLIGGLRALGCRLRQRDLAQYAVREDPALRVDLGTYQLLTCAPNSSGVLLAQAMLALRATECSDPLGRDASVLAAIFAVGNEQRERLLADPQTHAFDREAWLGEEQVARIAQRARAVAAGRAMPAAVAARRRATGDTAGIVAIDDEGRAVSLIQSLFHHFGAQVLEASTGILLHNRGAAFSLDSSHPNALAPGKRPAHTLMPVLVERDGALVGALGAMGGKVQPQVHAQVLLRLLAGTPPQEAVAAPRFAVGATELGEPATTVRAEVDCAPEALRALRAAGFDAVEVPARSGYLGHAQVIWIDGEELGASDPRADGSALRVQ